MFKFRLAVIAIAVIIIIVPSNSMAAMPPGTLNVKITPALKAKYPCIKAVLTQVLRTLEDPNSWDTKFWFEKVPTTGTVSNDQFKTVADDMRKYLTDGSVTIM